MNAVLLRISNGLGFVDAEKMRFLFFQHFFYGMPKMNVNRNIYCCPRTGLPLSCHSELSESDEVVSGILSAEGAANYPIRDGIPDFILSDQLSLEQSSALAYYDREAEAYDDVAHLSFSIQYCDEEVTRKKFIDLLGLKPNHRVLELACGTGRDSINIVRKLDGSGQFYLQDISRPMLSQCRKKLKHASVPVELSTGNACNLSFPDNYFDAVFSFGGIGVFGDIDQSLSEISRVTKVGGRVVVGDESLAPWLYETEYGRILLNNNPLFSAELPLRHLPREARDVRVQWVVGGVYYLIDFSIGEGDPPANYDLEIPGVRGGTLRTRYYGKLEGVLPETAELAKRAREKSGKSMHKWLDDVVSQAARAELDKLP